MKENEFDIYVRNLMAGAEESVSPDVWKGVEAGLDRAARRPVPMWLWRGLAGTGIAAAVAAAFLLLRPEKNLSNQPTIQQPVAEATDAPLPAGFRPEEDDVTPMEQQVARIKRYTAHNPEILTPVTMEEEPLTAEVEITESCRKPDAVIVPQGVPQESFADDEEAFRQLAFEEHKMHRKGEFSMSVLGNIQSNTRPEGPANKMRRSAGSFFAPPPTKPGIFREGTEFSFGLPVSAGLSLRYDFNPRWGIGTGVVYTNLSRSFLGDFNKQLEDGSVTPLYDTDITNQQHFVGIPVNVFFNIVNTGNWNFHVRLDGMGEKLVDNHFLIHDSEGDIHLHQKTEGLQFSAGVGVGVEFKFSPNVGIYFDPTLRYYFDGNQPRSIRTIQPLRMDFEAGLLFSLGR
jgi:hypothetical protein